MIKIILTFLFVLVPLFDVKSQNNNNDLTKYVNPFIGTGGHGHTYPGASVPFGMVQLSPDTRLSGWDGCGGYHYSDSIIYGFTHTHLSGTGVPDYCDILIMPTSGDINFNNKEYSSSFQHKNETATAGYYSVMLDKFHIKAELTATKRAGFHKYTFNGYNSNFIIDLKHRNEVLESNIKFVNNQEICGFRRSKEWARNKVVYFVMKFSEPFIENGIAVNDILIDDKEFAEGKNIKAYVKFNTDSRKIVYVKVGISAVSIEGAYKNLDAEIPDWDFEKVRMDAKEEWNKELNKIVVEDNSVEKKTIFYTALYHCFLCPNLYMDVDSMFRGTDKQIHKANGFANHTVFSLWDTYRAEHPLFTIIQQKRTSDFINTFLAQYEYGGMLPVWELSGNETFCMIGYHSVPVIVDAYVKGIRGFDVNKAFDAMRHSADTNLFGLECYRKFGFVPQDCEHESVSKTLEYAYDDWCIAQYAKILKNKSEYNRFIERSQYYKNVFDPSTGFMRAKINGGWYKPFDPYEVNANYTEANAWQYTLNVPHDIYGLSNLMDKDSIWMSYKLVNKLDDLFSTTSKMTGFDLEDISGMIGQYAHGNEPSHHIAYMYDCFIANEYKTQKYVHQIITDFYKNAPDGLIGNEDCGQMSAWYVLSAMGFYPLCPGSPVYAIGTPLFDKVTINIENGKHFIIRAKNVAGKNFYIQSKTINNKPLENYFLSHSDIINGGELVFEMGNTENKKFPEKFDFITSSDDYNIVPIVIVPVIEAKGKTFKDSMQIEMIKIVNKNFENSVFIPRIYYTLDGSEPDMSSNLYSIPFTIIKNTTIKAFIVFDIMDYAFKKRGKSKTVIAEFFKIPTNWSIKLLTDYDKKYSAGGPDGLIDGIRGKKNWRLGDWQGYQGKDFEAVVDLGKVQELKKIGAGFLQDARSWIWMPTEITIEVSDDGINFKNISTIKNDVPETDLNVIIKDYTTDVNLSSRYIRVKAKNYGKIPSWHPGAGDDAYIFVDEIIIE